MLAKTLCEALCKIDQLQQDAEIVHVILHMPRHACVAVMGLNTHQSTCGAETCGL